MRGKKAKTLRKMVSAMYPNTDSFDVEYNREMQEIRRVGKARLKRKGKPYTVTLDLDCGRAKYKALKRTYKG